MIPHPAPRLVLVLFSVLLPSLVPAAEPANRIGYNGQELFLNGTNLAWKSFANDIGPSGYSPDLAHFEQVFRKLQANGANSMRLWLHTTGAFTPEWNGSMVTGPGTDTIKDLGSILDLARQYDVGMILCLWSFDMLRITEGAPVTDRNMAILTQPANRQSYIDNSLMPMVEAFKDHPAVLCWEIFNEPEGMSNEHGWDITRHVPMADIQAFINLCAGTIHRTDPGVLVSNGSWAFIASSDVGEGNFNYYTDERLIAAGGDPDGTLDFYMVHYYDWAGPELSPFNYPASHWGLDKPLVVAEFYPNCQYCGEHSHEVLYENGYAGALNWSWTDRNPAELLEEIAYTSARHADDILLEQVGKPEVSLLQPAGRSWFVSGIPVVLEAAANDPDGAVERVVFYLDGHATGEDTTPPYQIELGELSTGSYTVSAAAIDDQGLRSATAEIPVHVGRPDLLERFEAETADLDAVTVETDLQASGDAYADLRGSGSILWTINNIPSAGTYDLVIGYNLGYATPKTNLLSINSGSAEAVEFSGPVGQWAEKTIQVPLQAGTNTLEITPSWGWMYFDYIALPGLGQAASPEILNVSLSGDATHISAYGPPGIEYDFLYSADLVHWSVLQSFTPSVMPAELTDISSNGQPWRFYRISSGSTGQSGIQ